jgi:hypothetical protein
MSAWGDRERSELAVNLLWEDGRNQVNNARQVGVAGGVAILGLLWVVGKLFSIPVFGDFDRQGPWQWPFLAALVAGFAAYRLWKQQGLRKLTEVMHAAKELGVRQWDDPARRPPL